jgi:hypothetical protein
VIAEAPALARPVRLVRSSRWLESLAFLSVVTVLLLSTWGPALLRVNGYYAPELIAPFLIVYLWLRRPRVLRSILRCVLSPVGVAATLWLSFVAVIGIGLRGSAVGPYSEWRASALLVYAFLLMYTRRGQQGDLWATRLMWVSFAVLCLDALLVGLRILSPGFLGQPIQESNEAAIFGLGRISIPAINIVVVSYLAGRGRRLALLSAALVLGGVLSLGGHRVVLVATAISALFVPLFMVRVLRATRMRGRWRRIALAPAIIVAMIAGFQSSAIQNYLEGAKGIQFRLFTHTFDTLVGIKEGLTGSRPIEYGDETIRAAYAAYILTQWPSLLLPHGLGSREVVGRLGPEFDEVAARWGVESKAAHTHDNAVLYAAYHHGLLMTGVVTIVFGWLLLHRLRIEAGVVGKLHVMVAVAGVMLIDMIYPPVPGINEAGIYGLFLGTLLNPSALRPLARRRAKRRKMSRGTSPA